MAAGLPSTCTQQVETLLVALKSVLPECGKEGSLLRHVLQSAASADTSHKHIDPEQFQALCEDCSKMFAFLEKAGQTVSSPTNNIREAKKIGLQMAPGVMQLLHASYGELDTNAASPQPHITDATAAFLKLARVALLSKEWLQLAGSETFTAVAASMRAAIKDSIMPLLCSLAAQGTAASGAAVLEPYKQLVSLGRFSADIIAGRLLLASQAKELRSFAVLNVAWSSIVRLLLALVNLPEQAHTTQSFQVADLLKLLIGYVQHEFDILMEQQDLNQLKVVRFWTQHVTRLATTFTTVGQLLWTPLVALVAHMHSSMPPIREPDSEVLQKICHEVQQHVLSKLGHLLAVCLPDCGAGSGMMPPWLEALCSEQTADSKTATHPLAAAPIAGKLMAALDILRHGTLLPAGAQMTCSESLLPMVMAGTCKHLYVKALSCPALKNAVAQAMLVFMAACCSNRDSVEAWQQCEIFLVRQALMPNPLRLHLLAHVWSAIIRQATPELAATHVQALHKMVMTLAQCYHGQGSDAKCDEANRQMLSHSLQQLVQLTAHLLLALPLDARQHLAQSLLQGATGRASISSANAAAVAATLRVLQLARSASEPALPAGADVKLLQETNRAASQTQGPALSVLLACMAEAVALHQASTEQADTPEASQSFQITVGVVAAAEGDEAWGGPALHILYQLRHMLGSAHLAQLLPALLRLQRNHQAAPYVAALAGCYAEAQAPPVQLFHTILEEQHWALQYEAMESLLLYSRSPKSGDIKQVLPRSLYNPETIEGRSSPFIALLKEHMQRSTAAGTPILPQDCCELEQKSQTIYEQVPNLVAQQEASHTAAPADDIHHDQTLSSSIAQAVQALEDVHRNVMAHLPMQCDEQKLVVQEQLTLLAQIAQGCMSGA